ncbi:HesA/MoeB/ThiF family protein [Cereibacter azotoformans]|uniref:Molybdopterin-synthase adenylyltransferase n=1 Tax=Cereibacter azotoformans TaxID=43057 RepID=A0A2T5JXM9_9RHOB|nr:HesA/MoeB/ThiF family protein [Cereibacter azotoformans]AXQ92740.1 HesA/MoeB/ThiF family protein [Cereibacter sphaeroides]MBO4169647.1 HesA/MoeB/ThiF family protein [Cereibacter azotoformans]PTR14924.1 molybdopterin/thiamine biosynthesis adenylyltransferase [Cereibacter azotoformans]UIJ31023.1 HesA/MoeB/ThiF family protein [Cereibacter azotoformans]
MLALILFAAGLWGLAWFLGMPVRLRLLALSVLWLAVVLAHLLLPEAHPFRQATGGGPEPWLVIGGLAALVLGYRLGLGALRRRARGAEAPPAPGLFRPAELERYARHIMLREVGGPGQKRLKEARVLVIGAGGLGSPALLYLAAAGVGTVGVIDADRVEASNLQRQVIHTDARIGWPKVRSAAEAMRALNPFVEVRPYERRLTEENAAALFADYDLILDGTDNFDTRYLANRMAVAAEKPLISGAITQWEGQVSLYDPARGGPCFQCTFPERPAPGLVPSCAEAGVIAPLPGVVGSIMAVEAIKHLTGAGATLRGALLIHDALWGETRRIALKPRAGCPVCGGRGGAG